VSAASDNGHVTQSLRELTPAGRLTARVRSAARRPVLWGASCGGDLALAAVVTFVAVAVAAKGYLYVQPVPHTPLAVTPSHPLPLGWRPHMLRLLSLTLIGVVASTAPLAFRRTHPTSAFGVMLVAFIATRSYSTGITVAALIFAGYCAIAYSKYRVMTLLGLLAGAIVITAAYPSASVQVPARYIALLVLLPTAALGNMMRMWRLRAAESAERLRLAQAAHEAGTRHAVELERARIASEMHDVVTHNVSVMVVQAGGARVADSVPDDVREALQAIEASGRVAMTELRHLLGLLVPAGPSAGPGEAGETAAAGDDHAALRPQPGLYQVPALVAGVRAAGLPVELSVAGTPRELPHGPDLAAYRVIQEALTNVLKHADRARTTVRIEHRPHDLVVDVANDAPCSAPGGGGEGAGAGSGGGSGRGLIGLRERTAIYRGSLDAGPRPGGGWRVCAVIPVDETDAAPDAAAPDRFRGALT
jgi:signal transduction histidine kinase